MLKVVEGVRPMSDFTVYRTTVEIDGVASPQWFLYSRFVEDELNGILPEKIRATLSDQPLEGVKPIYVVAGAVVDRRFGRNWWWGREKETKGTEAMLSIVHLFLNEFWPQSRLGEKHDL